VFLDIGPPDRGKEKWALPLAELAQFSKENDRNCSGYETAWPSASSVPSFRPGAQCHFENFTQSNSVEIGPTDPYGYGRGFAVRGNGKSFRPAVLESAEETSEASLPAKISAEAALLDVIGINVELEHNHSNRADCRKRAKFVKKRRVKDPAIGITKRESRKLLKDAGYDDLSAQVGGCGQEYLINICRVCQQKGQPSFHGIAHTIDPCDLIYFCPDCARHRSGRAKKRYTPIVQKFAHLNRLLYTPIFITLTIRSGFDLEMLLDLLFKSFRRFRSRSAWKNHIVGAIASCELTFNPQHGWHPHLHILAFRRAFWDSDELNGSWAASTCGEGLITDIRKIEGDLKGTLSELLKYITKPCDIKKLGLEQVHELVALKRRMVMTLGKLRKFEVTKDDRREYGDDADYDPLNCLVCDAPLSSVLFSAEELERMSCIVVLRGP